MSSLVCLVFPIAPPRGEKKNNPDRVANAWLVKRVSETPQSVTHPPRQFRASPHVRLFNNLMRLSLGRSPVGSNTEATGSWPHLPARFTGRTGWFRLRVRSIRRLTHRINGETV